MSRVLLEEDVYGVNCIEFHGDRFFFSRIMSICKNYLIYLFPTTSLIVGVDGPLVYHVLFSGDVTVKMPATPLRVYSLCLQKKNEVLIYFFKLMLIFKCNYL